MTGDTGDTVFDFSHSAASLGREVDFDVTTVIRQHAP